MSAIIDLILPRLCPICEQRVKKDEVLHRACIDTLPKTNQAYFDTNNTSVLFADDKHFVRGAAWLKFRKHDLTQQLIHHAKYGLWPEINEALAREAAIEFMEADFFEGIDVIIPIPLHPQRKRKRGYNQSDYIARSLSAITHIPIDTTHITRTRNNPNQARMTGKEREENVKGIFAINHPEELYRKHILLVDDVITTGATIRECIHAMHAFRGCHVSVFALATAG